MEVVSTFEDTRSHARGKVGLVPTMGFLHEGHLALIAAAREDCRTVVVSVFVNPLQFNEAQDLDRYPRDLDRDKTLIDRAGADVLFAPGLEEMYPIPAVTRVTVPPLEAEMEGAHRPGHFAGVATVVTKLLAGLQPDRVYFGKKDAQQLAIVRRLVFDLSIPVEVIGRPTVREADGLALSSRNVFLDAHERMRALGLSAGLMAAADAAEEGELRAAVLESLVREAAAQTSVEYVTLADADTVTRIDRLERPAFLAIAARVGSTRLIDNVHFGFDGAGRPIADRGSRLTEASILYGG